MPIPLLIAGAATVAGTAGVVKGAKAVKNLEEAKKLIEEASQMVSESHSRFESQKQRTSSILKNLGEIKLDAWSEDMEDFVMEFGYFKNVKMDRNKALKSPQIKMIESPQQMYVDMYNGALSANEMLKIGSASLGAGAVIGVAAYGGAMLFAKASTGTAISALSGAAATNATLAWFGGGSLATGGLGMLGGKLMLGGIVVAPVVAVAGFVMEAKSKEKLANARMVYAEAQESAEKMNIMTSYMKGIADVSADYADFVQRFGRVFEPFIDELNRIRSERYLGDGEKIDFDSLTEAEQKTLHLSWLMAQIYYQLLSSPILNEDGEIDESAMPALENAGKALRKIEKETFSMDGELSDVGGLMWYGKAKKMLVINFAFMGFLIAIGVLSIRSNILGGLLLILDAAVACPVFFKFTYLGPGKKYMWRSIRLAVAVSLMLLIFIFVR